MRILNITLMAAVLAMASCNEEHDPIGPNKPSPVLIVSPLELAYDGTGGSLTSKISTNAESVTIGELPDWVESASVNEDNTSVTVTVKPNEDSYAVKRGTLKLVSSSGDNTVTQYMKLYQAGKDSKMSFASFSGKSLPTGWFIDDRNLVSVGNGYLSFKAEGNPGHLYTCNQKYNPSGRKFYLSVDLKMNGGEGGAKLYLNEDKNQVLEIYMSYNGSTNRGGIWVKNGESWLAMDDGVVGSGDNPNKVEEVSPIPDAAERDDWWRLTVSTTDTSPETPVVTIKSLKTFNGETSELLAHYSRKFTVRKPDLGNVALWARNGESQFRNFVLSYQE